MKLQNVNESLSNTLRANPFPLNFNYFSSKNVFHPFSFHWLENFPNHNPPEQPRCDIECLEVKSFHTQWFYFFVGEIFFCFLCEDELNQKKDCPPFFVCISYDWALANVGPFKQIGAKQVIPGRRGRVCEGMLISCELHAEADLRKGMPSFLETEPIGVAWCCLVLGHVLLGLIGANTRLYK